MKRREFIEKSIKSSVALGTLPLILPTNMRWKGANDRVNVAVIGIRGQGQSHIMSYQQLKDVEVSAICDVDENLFADCLKKHYTNKGLREPKIYKDMRKLFEDKSVDAVSIVTPNHWHALSGIWAIQAGKHTSIEKPSCHTIHEGKMLIEAAAKSGLVVQDGAEQRSDPSAQTMYRFLKDGKLGEVYMAKGLCYKWRDTINKIPDGYNGQYTQKYMEKVDYDMWLGPAPLKPFNSNRFHYNWHWNWDYGNGDMGNQGVHEMDIARWGLDVKIPSKVSAMGGHVMFDDDQQTPNVLMATFEFNNPKGGGEKKKILQFEVRHWMTNPEESLGSRSKFTDTYMNSASNIVGNIFYGSKGYMLKELSGWQVFMGKERTPGESDKGGGDHYQDFIDAIRAGDPKKLTGPIEEGFYSCLLVHLANISYRLGRTLHIDTEKLQVINDEEANRMFTKEYRKPYTLPEKI